MYVYLSGAYFLFIYLFLYFLNYKSINYINKTHICYKQFCINKKIYIYIITINEIKIYKNHNYIYIYITSTNKITIKGT